MNFERKCWTVAQLQGHKCFSKKLAGLHRERWLEESPRTRTKFAPESTYGLCATWEANVWTHESIITVTENILWMCPANERRCYIVTSFLIAWTHTQNDPCCNPKKWHLFKEKSRHNCHDVSIRVNAFEIIVCRSTTILAMATILGYCCWYSIWHKSLHSFTLNIIDAVICVLCLAVQCPSLSERILQM